MEITEIRKIKHLGVTGWNLYVENNPWPIHLCETTARELLSRGNYEKEVAEHGPVKVATWYIKPKTA